MSQSVPKRRLVLLIVALVISLIAFEIAREGWVIAENRPVSTGTFSLTGSASEGFVIANGTWKRSDGGARIVPGVTEIRCVKPMNLCIEATSIVPSGSNFMSMNVDLFIVSEFSDTAVTYRNDIPQCATYSVRIDLAQKRVTATRDRRPDPELESCKLMEPRVAMELRDGYEGLTDAKWMDDHFLPLVKMVRAFF